MLEANKLSVNKRVTLRQDLEVKSEEVRVRLQKDQEEKLKRVFLLHLNLFALFCLAKKASVVSSVPSQVTVD